MAWHNYYLSNHRQYFLRGNKMTNIKTFKSDCWTVIDRSDINLKGLHYEIVTETFSNGSQSLLYIRETKSTMKKLLSDYLFEWAYECSDNGEYIIFSEEDFEGYSEFNPFLTDGGELL